MMGGRRGDAGAGSHFGGGSDQKDGYGLVGGELEAARSPPHSRRPIYIDEGLAHATHILQPEDRSVPPSISRRSET